MTSTSEAGHAFFVTRVASPGSQKCQRLVFDPEGVLHRPLTQFASFAQRRPSKPVNRNPFTLPVKLDRRLGDARRRLARLSKSDLVGQLLELQNAYAVIRAAWLQASAQNSRRGPQQ